MKATKVSRTLAGLVGRTVAIDWRDDDGDWPAFRVLAMDSGWLLLRQVRGDVPGTPDKHPFWCPMADMLTIREVTP